MALFSSVSHECFYVHERRFEEYCYKLSNCFPKLQHYERPTHSKRHFFSVALERVCNGKPKCLRIRAEDNHRAEGRQPAMLDSFCDPEILVYEACMREAGQHFLFINISGSQCQYSPRQKKRATMCPWWGFATFSFLLFLQRSFQTMPSSKAINDNLNNFHFSLFW